MSDEGLLKKIEVVGYSGGTKYLFPGISGGDFLHFFHWLGAVITCWNTIGYRDTPVRRLVERAARMVPARTPSRNSLRVRSPTKTRWSAMGKRSLRV